MDLAETVDDLICIFDGSGDTTMDTLAMFIFGWILVALFVLWLGRLVYNRFIVKRIDKVTEPAAVSSVVGVAKTTADLVDSKVAVSGDVDATKASASSATPVVRSGARTVAATPPLRRRLTRQSPAPEPKKKYIPAPTTTGSDNVSVLWVNDVFQWLYNDMVIVNELLNVWIQSLNAFCKKSVAEEGIGVEFVRILPETHPPSLTNVFSECATNDDVTITCDCEATPAFQLKCFRLKGEKMETSHYRVNLNRFRARLNIFCVSEKLQADVKCDGWPEVKIGLAPVGNIKNNLDETQLQELITEIIANALRSTEVHLNLAAYPSCPRLVRNVDPPGRPHVMHYDNQTNAYTSTPIRGSEGGEREKRLLVKVVKATQLGATGGCKEPYCVVEMDEPSQKNQTHVQKNTDCPAWDEHFLFDVTSNTAELLFEVYDHGVSPHKFLGLGIVGVEELLINPSQRQIISLQSRPYESDQISGTLTVEFMFIEGADMPNLTDGHQPYKIKETLKSGNLSPTTAIHNESLMNGNHAMGVASRSPAMNKNTLIVHSVQRQPSQRLVKVELSEGTWKEIERLEKPCVDDEEEQVESVRDAEKTESHPETEAEKQTSVVNETTNGNGISVGENGDETPPAVNGGAQPADGDHSGGNTLQPQLTGEIPDYRGRARKRRDFFGTIKRRLGRSKGRSKSAGPGEDLNGRDDSLNRSISADRSRTEDNYRLGLPGRNDLENSRRSSISEASGMSSASTRTYINEASTLVLETLENGIKKHYLVPLSLAQKSKWRKKGTKLHIFNDHTFIAKHLVGGTVCQVCAKSLARRLGKQGYECRDCLLKCHKHCHVKVNDNCPTSTIHNIELSYIQNPYTDKNLRIL